MDMSFISDEAWHEFGTRYHAAAMFLLHASLGGELAHLRRLPDRNPWQGKRLAELEEWERRHEDIERRLS